VSQKKLFYYTFLAMMSGAFEGRKAKVLADLLSDEPDLSPKGKPDEDIVELLELLNAHPNYVTTSSCSGRAVVYLDAAKRDEPDNEDSRGKWLMSSHGSLSPKLLQSPSMDDINACLFGTLQVGPLWEANTSSPRFITCKFEPLVQARGCMLTQIIHVLCRDISSACTLLGVATQSGYRESGMSISASGTPQEKILVGIRTTAIRVDIPIAVYDDRVVRPLGLTRGYLNWLFHFLDDKFQENERRKQALFISVQNQFTKTAPAVESKDDRRIRKRMEGLKLQAQSKRETH
jgi:tRNA wybutosine-synthesizing protein 3